MILKDSFGKKHDYIGISLIDKCNLNCIYCNPKNQLYNLLKNNHILSYEELIRLITILVRDWGVKKVRFTRGEPLIRRDILKFFQMLSDIKKEIPFEVGITTNGTLLEDKISSLQLCGVNRLNISLDTLQRNKYIAITGKNLLDATLRSIYKALQCNFDKVKIKAVIIKNINEDELIDFIDHFRDTNLNIRFIEYMPFSGNGWVDSKFISWRKMVSIIETKYDLREIESEGNVAKDFSVSGDHLLLTLPHRLGKEGKESLRLLGETMEELS